jgi:hypothetical protein
MSERLFLFDTVMLVVKLVVVLFATVPEIEIVPVTVPMFM